ncbi:PaaX family transcriptional regulator [Arthrobacter bambusae]|uniref:Phenylacetic acid degradation operon negative regulatory protein n=1 Tax=Arthrobacter bambusae TaxID=1338426 RepID=A0AAW8DKT9_9MICC|nr:PaaX family transcriptional regulator C-terminal domain-containing protein [Arthrobacter bambusae]MDP9906209.1 phenylacetic acid degradation operon negative regulatory protein [Arthrobacter bambusae]MDQ0130558.1 phenylacetic acid degradation operon negative regulatory protein [Arthrobacter bambusae]MDQ0182233.1 phenylacetic acid degradation operon negative regulatory protein [Arthrobacter bambusae]
MLAVPAPPVRHQQLIVTIFGLYGRNAGDALPVSALISMLGTLGYDAPGVRSSVSRLKAKGVLKSVREDGVAKYRISESIRDVFREGDRRIFAPEQPVPLDAWVLAVFSVPESMRNRRHQLRSELSGLGFGSVASGVWIAPSQKLEQAKERLTSLGLIQFVDLFRSDYVFDGPMRPKISEWWDLKELDEEFTEFLELYKGAEKQWLELVGDDPQSALANSTEELRSDAFRYYIPMLTMWRRFPYRDPNLPADYLPEDWHGPAVRRSFQAVHRLAAPLAAAHARELIRGALNPAAA